MKTKSEKYFGNRENLYVKRNRYPTVERFYNSARECSAHRYLTYLISRVLSIFFSLFISSHYPLIFPGLPTSLENYTSLKS